MWNLYLDDERKPKTNRNWVICRSVKQAIKEIEMRGEMPSYISFDHDLGDNVPTGYDFAQWLIDQDIDKKWIFPEDFEFNVHSANPIGKQNIECCLNRYFLHKLETQIFEMIKSSQKGSDSELDSIISENLGTLCKHGFKE